MFCSKCGNELPAGSRFCNRCGTSFGAAETVRGYRYREPYFTPSRIVVSVGAILTALSCFLPMYSISFLGLTYDFKYWDGDDGKLFFAIAVLALVLALIPVRILTGFGLLAALAGFGVLYYDFHEMLEELASDSVKVGSFGIGAYLMIVGLITMIVGAILSFFNK